MFLNYFLYFKYVLKIIFIFSVLFLIILPICLIVFKNNSYKIIEKIKNKK